MVKRGLHSCRLPGLSCFPNQVLKLSPLCTWGQSPLWEDCIDSDEFAQVRRWSNLYFVVTHHRLVLQRAYRPTRWLQGFLMLLRMRLKLVVAVSGLLLISWRRLMPCPDCRCMPFSLSLVFHPNTWKDCGPWWHVYKGTLIWQANFPNHGGPLLVCLKVAHIAFVPCWPLPFVLLTLWPVLTALILHSMLTTGACSQILPKCCWKRFKHCRGLHAWLRRRLRQLNHGHGDQMPRREHFCGSIAHFR